MEDFPKYANKIFRKLVKYDDLVSVYDSYNRSVWPKKSIWFLHEARCVIGSCCA